MRNSHGAACVMAQLDSRKGQVPRAVQPVFAGMLLRLPVPQRQGPAPAAPSFPSLPLLPASLSGIQPQVLGKGAAQPLGPCCAQAAGAVRWSNQPRPDQRFLFLCQGPPLDLTSTKTPLSFSTCFFQVLLPVPYKFLQLCSLLSSAHSESLWPVSVSAAPSLNAILWGGACGPHRPCIVSGSFGIPSRMGFVFRDYK